MGKNIKIIIAAAVAVVAVAAIVACLFVFDFFGSDLPKYAPDGTDLIVYVNGKKLVKTKVFKAYKKTLVYEELVKASQKEGIDTDKALQGEACLFFNISDAMEGKGEWGPTVIYRGSQAGAVFKAMQKNAEKSVSDAEKRAAEARKEAEKDGREPSEDETFVPTLSTDKISGKQAYVFGAKYRNAAAIMLDKKTLQFSQVSRKENLIAEPLKKKSTDLTKAIDTGAIVSIVWKADIPEDLFKGNDNPAAKLAKSAVDGLEIVTLNVKESGGSLKVTLVGRYKSSEKANAAKEAVIALRKLAQDDLAGKDKYEDAADMLKALEISQRGKKVTVTLKYSEDKLVAMIEKADREFRELRKEIEKK